MRVFALSLSVILYALIGVFLILFGILYASVSDMLPFHAAAVPEAHRDEMKPLYLALMKLIGGASGALGLLGIVCTLGPIRRGSSMIALTVAACYFTAFGVAAWVAETLADATGAPTSWHIMGILSAITLVGLTSFFVAEHLRKPKASLH